MDSVEREAMLMVARAEMGQLAVTASAVDSLSAEAIERIA